MFVYREKVNLSNPRKKQSESTEHCPYNTQGKQQTGSAQYADKQSAHAAEGDAADGRAV